MERLPKGVYSPEFREQAVRLHGTDQPTVQHRRLTRCPRHGSFFAFLFRPWRGAALMRS